MARSDVPGNREPRWRQSSFTCPSCGVLAYQTWDELWLGSDRTKEWFRIVEEPGELEGSGPYFSWDGAICKNCGAPSMWRGQLMVYPRTSTLPPPHEDMPAEARELYEEARAVQVVSPRAGAALARATLERLLRTVDPVNGKQPDLAERIDRVTEHVSVPLAQMLTIVRHVGNQALHVKDVPDEVTVLAMSDEQTEISALLFEAVNTLVDELITKPAVADSLYEKLPEKVREAVKRSQQRRAIEPPPE